MAAAAVRTTKYPRSYRRGPGSASYDGNAARVLDREEVLQPRPEIRQRQKAIARPKVRVREAGRVSVFGVVGFLAVGVIAVLVLVYSLQLAKLSDQVVALDHELTALQGVEAKLRAKYELAFDISAIEREMTASGRMVKPQSNQIVYLDLSEPDSVILFRSDESRTKGFEGALDSIGKVFDDIVEYFR